MREGFKWNYSRIDAANYCTMRYYLRYVQHEVPVRLSAYVKGSLLHTLVEKFWDYYGSEEEVMADRKNKKKKSKEKKHFFDRDSFSDYARGQWTSIIMADNRMKQKVAQMEKETGISPKEQRDLDRWKGEVIGWRDEAEPYVIKGMIPKICRPWFDKIVEEGKPLFTELPFNFALNGRRFDGRIDEVRLRDGKVVIRDYKSGSPWLSHMKLDFDPQLTFYNMALCSLVMDSKDFANHIGLDHAREGITRRFNEEGVLIYDDFVEEFFMIEALQRIDAARLMEERPTPKKREFPTEEDYNEAVKRRNIILGNIPPLTRTTTRQKFHYLELMDMIEKTEQDLMFPEKIIAETGRKCDGCDMKEACKRRILNRDCHQDKKENGDYHGQRYFGFVDADSIIKQERKAYKPGYVQKKLSFRRAKKK